MNLANLQDVLVVLILTLVSPPTCLCLQAPAHRFRHTKFALEQAFGMRLEEMFESIEKAPVASGSIGQIHRAMLSKKGAKVTGCTPGQVVAVKVSARVKDGG